MTNLPKSFFKRILIKLGEQDTKILMFAAMLDACDTIEGGAAVMLTIDNAVKELEPLGLLHSFGHSFTEFTHYADNSWKLWYEPKKGGYRNSPNGQEGICFERDTSGKYSISTPEKSTRFKGILGNAYKKA